MGIGVRYHLAELLRALYENRHQFRPVKEDFKRNSHNAGLSRIGFQARQLEDHRQFFETNFMRIILTDNSKNVINSVTEPLHSQIISSLKTLFQLLEKIANQNFEPSGYRTIPRHDFTPLRLYPRLEHIITVMCQSEGPFDSTTGTHRSAFVLANLEEGKEARSAVRDVVQALNSARSFDDTRPKVRLPVRKPMGSISRDTQDPIKNFIQFFDREYRALVGRILETVTTELEKCPPILGHKVMIQLPSIKDSDAFRSDCLQIVEGELDGFVYCPELSQWHNIHCRFDHETQAKNSEAQRLCQVVKVALERGEGILLLFDKALAAFIESPDAFDLPPTNPNIYPIRKLKEMITADGFFNLPSSKLKGPRLFKHIERRELAAKLALHLLIVCGSKQASPMDSWDGNHVAFLSTSDSLDDCNRQSPYISWWLDHDSSDSRCFIPLDNCKDNPERFTQLARLLIEIEYGPITTDDEGFGPNDKHGWRIIRDFLVNQRSFDEATKSNYLDAVEYCLRFGDFFRYEYRSEITRNTESREDICRRIIKTKIVPKLLEDLPVFKRPLPKRARFSEREDQFSNVGEQLPELHYHNKSDVERQNEYRPTSLDVRRRAIESPNPVALSTRTPSPAVGQGGRSGNNGLRLRELKQPRLMESPHSQTLPLNYYRIDSLGFLAESAKEWLQKLKETVHSILKCRRRESDEMVKVAVLDTGIDILHPMITKDIEENGSKITERKDWTQSPHGTDDQVGHGTAVCEILLRVAKVNLYVGKISDTALFNDLTPGIVAQALEHAVSSKGWNVDIVVLSLGFERSDESIDQAVRNAYARKKIIFAAASNSGSLIPKTKVSFPARIPGVISIRSASGQSVRSNASPTYQNGDDNYMTLGEGIEAAWPIKLNSGNQTRYVSGSSFATPVAAGIAALALEFSIQQWKGIANVKTSKDILWTHGGIRKILDSMCRVDNQQFNPDCRMIVPWTLFDPDRLEYAGHGIEIDLLMQSK
ncbi:hypothetical protein TWF481_011583 [Arthrobotrys musiformis]|uniref:Peptidase S8/S53 domain-containing protein n=1 Tax=Arthrobotrys musiformis TaxID=47236 RepID=A0AAV9W4R7_9PEZI